MFVEKTEAELESMSLGDIRNYEGEFIAAKAAEAAAAASTTTTLASTTEEVSTIVETTTTGEDVTAKRVYQTESTIDLGDGAGVQVFRATGDTELKAERALTAKLAEAQTNATRKIRAQAAELKTRTVTPSETAAQVADEAVLSHEMLSKPTEAVKKIFKSITGMDITEFRSVTEKAAKFQEAQERKTIADSFVAAHPEFVDNDRNAQRLNKAVKLQGSFSLDNLEKAYQDLNESGLLEVKATGASAGQETAEEKAQRIAASSQEAASSQRTRRSSGLSTQRTSATPPPAAPSEEDLYDGSKFSLDKLRQLANQQLSAQR